MKKSNLSAPALALLICGSFHTAAALADPQLTYSYASKLIWNPNADFLYTITINNNGATPVSIAQLNFDTNTNTISQTSGTLAAGSISSQSDPDGFKKDFTIQENISVTIQPNQSAQFSFHADSLTGPLFPYNLSTCPKHLTVKFTGSATPVSIPVQGKCKGSACVDPGNGKRITGYFTDWTYWRNPQYLANKVPYNKINTLIYAFSIFDSDGKVSLFDSASDPQNLPMIEQARQQYPYLNASLSFGGWSWYSTPPGWACKKGDGPSACFSQLTQNSNTRQTFVKNAVQAMKEVNFNGIDIDWEYPKTAADAGNYVKLLQELRAALDAQGKTDNTHYYLTIAAPAGIEKIQALTQSQWQAVAQAVDYLDVMAYDFHGAWDKYSDFMSPMKVSLQDPYSKDPIFGKYDVSDAITLYLSTYKIPASKLILGIPAYGRLVNINNTGNEGLYQIITSTTPQGEYDNTGVVNYNCIEDASTCNSGFTMPSLTFLDPTTDPLGLGKSSLTPWGYNANTFISFDDVKSVTKKANWLENKGLAGAMFWELSGDFPVSDPRSLIGAVQKVFSSPR